jgi:hypothetical protein
VENGPEQGTSWWGGSKGLATRCRLTRILN